MPNLVAEFTIEPFEPATPGPHVQAAIDAAVAAAAGSSELVVEVGDEKQSVPADTVIDSPKDIPHCWYNESDSLLRVLVVKVPKPTKGSKLL